MKIEVDGLCPFVPLLPLALFGTNDDPFFSWHIARQEDRKECGGSGQQRCDGKSKRSGEGGTTLFATEEPTHVSIRVAKRKHNGPVSYICSLVRVFTQFSQVP